jgi:prefoldin subunit 5
MNQNYHHLDKIEMKSEQHRGQTPGIKKAAPLIKEMLVAVDKELYARAEVRAVEGVRLVEGRNNRSWNIEDEE